MLLLLSATTRLQLEQKSTTNDSNNKPGLLGMIQRIYQQGGVHGLYRGLGADSIATLLSSFIYFYCYTALRNLQEKMNKSMGKSSVALNVYQELFLGAEAALISRFFTSPVSNITTRLQTGKKQQSFMEIAKEIYDEKSITGFWTGKKGRNVESWASHTHTHTQTCFIGYRASIVLVSNPSITYFVFEKLKAFYMRTYNKTALTSLQTFLFSALAKSVATMITYPFIFLRANMVGGSTDAKGKSKKEDQQQRPGMVALLKQVVEKEGATGVYKVSERKNACV